MTDKPTTEDCLRWITGQGPWIVGAKRIADEITFRVCEYDKLQNSVLRDENRRLWDINFKLEEQRDKLKAEIEDYKTLCKACVEVRELKGAWEYCDKERLELLAERDKLKAIADAARALVNAEGCPEWQVVDAEDGEKSIVMLKQVVDLKKALEKYDGRQADD
jgi:hypothetical protein